MTEQPRDWDKELADIDRAIARQPGAPPADSTARTAAATPRRRFAALAWFWALLSIVLAVALIVWPYDKSCGVRLIFFLGAALLTLLAGVLGAFTSWAHRQGAAMLLSLLVVLFAGIMAAREILPRAGYAKDTLEWTCPPAPPAPTPAPQPSPQ
jgi:peptidoglycan/LPS O-acetylase OafA/YrhL